MNIFEFFSILIVKHTVTVAFVAGVCNLITEFLTDAFIILGMLQSAGTVSPGSFQPFPDRFDHFLILIQSDSHRYFLLFEKSIHPLGWMDWRRV